MPEIPFHVAGGSFSGDRPLAFDPDTIAPYRTPGEATAANQSSRRRKLWEVPHKCHCPIIGTCFPVDELRALMHKVMLLPKGTIDFVLHTTAVGTCETRSRLAEVLHKTLEKRYQLTIKRFVAAKTTEGLRALWQAATQSGSDIPGALWAAWSHPACDAVLEQEIYGDIHMIQHQVGTGARADIRAMQATRNENAELRRQLAQARRESESIRNEKVLETQKLKEQISALQAAEVGRDACIARLSAQLDQLRGSLPDLKGRLALARRASDSEARAAALTAQCREQREEIERLSRQLQRTDEELPTPPPADAPPHQPEIAELDAIDGKCVLCVGGRTGSIDAYRQIIEQRGGRFLHHDGGLEESLHRMDGFLAAADLIICQAGCISHNAYWRVKEQCKRTGKPCIYMKGSGISALSRLIDQAHPETAQPAAAT
jgi:hypothetical protein